MALTTPIEVINERPTCCTFTSGRMFYGMKNSVYFSQVNENETSDFINRCYQKNDPTAEQLSDLLDTDGGTIQIDNAVEIIQLESIKNGVVVYAKNGVWWISGPDTGFTATNHFVERVSDTGVLSAQGVVVVGNTHYYWSNEGIYSLDINANGDVEETNIIEGSLQTFFNKIPLNSRKRVNGVYDRINKQVEWFYTSVDQANTDDYKFAYDLSLVLDLRTGGMWPQSYIGAKNEAESSSQPFMLLGGVGTKLATTTEEVNYLVMALGVLGASQTYSIHFSNKNNTEFKDYGTTYTTAYIETGYEALDKPSNKKSAPYITTHFKQTEENFISDGAGGVKLDKQSGCQLRAKWDWANSSANGRWSPNQQAYRFRRIFVPSGVGVFDSGNDVITTKNKVLGSGKALSLRLEQEANKDFQLLGYTISWSIKGKI